LIKEKALGKKDSEVEPEESEVGQGAFSKIEEPDEVRFTNLMKKFSGVWDRIVKRIRRLKAEKQ
jgi:hypothetical protein